MELLNSANSLISIKPILWIPFTLSTCPFRWWLWLVSLLQPLLPHPLLLMEFSFHFSLTIICHKLRLSIHQCKPLVVQFSSNGSWSKLYHNHTWRPILVQVLERSTNLTLLRVFPACLLGKSLPWQFQVITYRLTWLMFTSRVRCFSEAEFCVLMSRNVQPLLNKLIIHQSLLMLMLSLLSPRFRSRHRIMRLCIRLKLTIKTDWSKTTWFKHHPKENWPTKLFRKILLLYVL